MRAQSRRAQPFGLHEDQRGGHAFCTQSRALSPQRLPNCTGRSGRLNGVQTLPRWSGLKIQGGGVGLIYPSRSHRRSAQRHSQRHGAHAGLGLGKEVWLGKLCGTAADGADFIKRRSHRCASTPPLGVDGCGLRSPACQAPNLHHYSTGQMSMKGSCNKRRLLCFE